MVISNRTRWGWNCPSHNRNTRFDIDIAELEPASKEITSPVIWESGKSKGSSGRLSAALTLPPVGEDLLREGRQGGTSTLTPSAMGGQGDTAALKCNF